MSYQSSLGIPAERRVVLRITSFNKVIPFGAAIAAASLVAGASSSTYAATVSPERLGTAGSRVLAAAREEDAGVSIAEAVGEIKRRAGLTWNNLARLFGVSRRAVHDWANGQSVKLAHAEKVEALLERVRTERDLRPFQLRQLLLSEANIVEQPAFANGEPAILVSDPTPFRHQIEVRRKGATKVVRSRTERDA